MSTAVTTRSPKQAFPNVLSKSLEEKIRRRAYELFLGRGAQHGRDLDDWLQAETELVRQAVAASPLRAVPPSKPRRKK
jgi:hypothetical protein